jgi:hypothetical protein
MDEGIEPEPKRGFDCETGKAAMARSVAEVLRAFQTGRAPFSDLLAALVAPFNGDDVPEL